MLKKDNTEGELCEREKGVLVKGNSMKIVGKKNMLVESRSYLQEREREREREMCYLQQLCKQYILVSLCNQFWNKVE